MSVDTALPSDFYHWPAQEQEAFLEQNVHVDTSTDESLLAHSKALIERYERRQKAREAQQAKRDRWYDDFMAKLREPLPACAHPSTHVVIDPDTLVDDRVIEGGQRLVCDKCRQTMESL